MRAPTLLIFGDADPIAPLAMGEYLQSLIPGARLLSIIGGYQGNKILWFTFSSTRDYGLRVLNHKNGMYQCYPPDSTENPSGMHMSTFDSACQQPQIWMAAITYAAGFPTIDPSHVPLWIPYQDMTTHNHTAQWTK